MCMSRAAKRKPAIELLKDFIQQRFRSGHQSFCFVDAQKWFAEHHPDRPQERIKTNLKILSTNSPSRRSHPVHKHGHNSILFSECDGSYRAFDPKVDPLPLTASAQVEKPSRPGEPPTVPERFKFRQELVLQSYLAGNLQSLEHGLNLHSDDGHGAIEFPCGKRRIDILARDTKKNWVVIELKVDKAKADVVDQIQHYMKWIKENVAAPKEQVRGIIVAHRVSKELRDLTKDIPAVSLREYEFKVKLRQG